ncbi:hypothetical protein [Persicitalea sp.]|uniref:hypothetical protein n=1 Tax=Persicitalea sp. TaxID=3100273 RepID=UPI003593CD06
MKCPTAHNFTLLSCLVVSSLLLTDCKSAKKSLKRGDYDQSVLLAVPKVNDNARSSSADILKEAYPLAVRQHQDDLRRNENPADPFRHERAAEIYTKLNTLYNAIQDCPACARLVTARSYFDQERNARDQAAATRYEAGQKALDLGGRDNARRAFEDFEAANAMVPNYRDATQKLDEAYQTASFKVVVEQVLVTSRAYQLSNAYFQDRVNEFLQTNRRLNKFVRFYTPQEASSEKVRPDHVVTLQFDDFVVGQTLVERNTEEVTSKDSVKTGEITVDGKKVPVYGKVKAKLSRNRKTVVSKGLLDMQIQDFDTKKIVFQDKFPGEYRWMSDWGSYNGDERALDAAQLRMTKSRETNPPPPQDLFVEFSKPIYNRLTSRLRSFYEKY